MNNSKTFSGSTNLINLPDTPSLMTSNESAEKESKPSKKVSLSNSNSVESLNNRKFGMKSSAKNESTLGLDEDPTSGGNKKPLLSSKPPINKQRNYKPSVKPIVQGWLYKRKQAHTSSITDLNSSGLISGATANSLNRSASNGNNNGGTSPHALIRTHLKRHHKWHYYWCVLMKDYITFYKQADDKTPKDFLLLKNFNLTPSTHTNGFVIIDKMKLIEHEFYADTQAEFKDWYQNLFELRVKQTRNEMSASTGSLNETNPVPAPSIPTSISASLARKNNLQMQLSTIIDSNDDLHNANNSNPKAETAESQPTSQTTPNGQANSISGARNLQSISSISPSALTSPTFNQLQQSYFNSSRESSPGISNNSKLASRDSSPGLNYSE